MDHSAINGTIELIVDAMGIPPELKESVQETIRNIVIPKRSGYIGSVPGRQFIDRKHEEGHNRLMEDYFAEEPKYPLEVFRRRFRMDRRLFLRIADDLSSR
jgi:hypothetical protein